MRTEPPENIIRPTPPDASGPRRAKRRRTALWPEAYMSVASSLYSPTSQCSRTSWPSASTSGCASVASVHGYAAVRANVRVAKRNMFVMGSRMRRHLTGAKCVRRNLAILRLIKVKAAPRIPQVAPMKIAGMKRRTLTSMASET